MHTLNLQLRLNPIKLKCYIDKLLISAFETHTSTFLTTIKAA